MYVAVCMCIILSVHLCMHVSVYVCVHCMAVEVSHVSCDVLLVMQPLSKHAHVWFPLTCRYLTKKVQQLYSSNSSAYSNHV